MIEHPQKHALRNIFHGLLNMGTLYAPDAYAEMIQLHDSDTDLPETIFGMLPNEYYAMRLRSLADCLDKNKN